jgi:hypothetical protein
MVSHECHTRQAFTHFPYLKDDVLAEFPLPPFRPAGNGLSRSMFLALGQMAQGQDQEVKGYQVEGGQE